MATDTTDPNFEPDEWLQVWTFTPESALEFFGLDASKHKVVVLKEAPTTEREIARYAPKAKLFGIRSMPAVPGAWATEDAKVKP